MHLKQKETACLQRFLLSKSEQAPAHVTTQMVQVNGHGISTTPKVYIVWKVKLVVTEHTSGFKFVQKVCSKAVQLSIVLHDTLQLL